MAETPMGPDAELAIVHRARLELDLADGHGEVRTIAVALSGAEQEFEWLARSAATFHRIPLRGGA